MHQVTVKILNCWFLFLIISVPSGNVQVSHVIPILLSSCLCASQFLSLYTFPVLNWPEQTPKNSQGPYAAGGFDTFGFSQQSQDCTDLIASCTQQNKLLCLILSPTSFPVHILKFFHRMTALNIQCTRDQQLNGQLPSFEWLEMF